MPTGYESRWGTIISPTIAQLHEFSQAVREALSRMRGAGMHGSANRLEDAAAVVTGDSIPLSANTLTEGAK